MEYFAGSDVLLEETALCIVDGAGPIVRETRVASEPEALVAFFSACGMTMEPVDLEACSLTAWLHAGLTEAGVPAIQFPPEKADAASFCGDDGRGNLVESPEPDGRNASRSRDRLRRLVLLTPSCGDPAPTAKRNE